jgi:hypothetical protein
VLGRFLDLREKIEVFMNGKSKPFLRLLYVEWSPDLKFLVDVTFLLNDLDTMLQENGQISKL